MCNERVIKMADEIENFITWATTVKRERNEFKETLVKLFEYLLES